MKMLMVEDNPETVEGIQLCIEIRFPSIKFISTGSGLKAIDMLKDDTFDVVLLDLGLPDIGGLELLKEMRGFSQVPILVVSARHDEQIVAQARALGASGFVSKPFEFNSLVDHLRKILAITP